MQRVLLSARTPLLGAARSTGASTSKSHLPAPRSMSTFLGPARLGCAARPSSRPCPSSLGALSRTSTGRSAASGPKGGGAARRGPIPWPFLPGGRRTFHSSRPAQDVFFVSESRPVPHATRADPFAAVPAFKQVLLMVTRATLIAVPIAWRWGLFKRFPVASRKLWQIPLLAFCLTVGLGLNQSPKTARWRLLLMTEREEMEWSDKRYAFPSMHALGPDESCRFEEFVSSEGVHILAPDDPRVGLVRSTCTRLIQALQDDSPVTCAAESTVEVLRKQEKMKRVIPSARTEALSMLPFLPEVRFDPSPIESTLMSFDP